ncbi:outer membrane protein assembly factor BamB family protein [Haladaptatus salinisoli]|uniref:outer membrane protein assembly factor BamB family protein n=1 Tax=Haladaptatus salinisoli TaxID=2884876 RepID=UPI001D0B1CBD|nr:PQQ-binding-like beta-propeller repeat protein [Haladaptatus salinisoli]
MVRRSHRRDFLRAAGVGLLAMGGGCSALRSTTLWTLELNGLLSRIPARYENGLVVGSTRVSDSELGTVTFDGEYDRVTKLPRTTTSPVLRGNEAYVEADGVVCEASLNADGFERYDTEYLSFGWFPPAIDGSRMFIAGFSGRVQRFGLFALDLDDRRVAWRRPFNEWPTAVATDGDSVFVSSAAGHVRAYAADDGEHRWTHATSENARLVCDRGTVFVASNDGVTALSRDGSERWYRRVVGNAPAVPAATKSTVYAALSVGSNGTRTTMAANPYLFAYDRRSGRKRWRKALPASISAPPSAVDGTVVVGTIDAEGDGDLLSVYDEGGTRRRRYEVESGIRMRPTLRGGTVVVGGFDGVVSAYGL